MSLTIKQENFCLSYIETGNASEAYRRSFSAGKMKPETINVKASELLSLGKVPVRISLRIYYASQRPDLDESVILDVLQNRYKGKGDNRQLIQRGVYTNDRLVREKHVFHGIDKLNPRTEIEIEPLLPVQGGLL